MAQIPSNKEFLTVYSKGMEGVMFSVMFLFLVPLMSSESVNLFSEDMHSSTNLRGTSLKLALHFRICQIAILLNASLLAK